MKFRQPDLCLGTAQFGLDYGITNINSKPNEEELLSILNFANSENIKFLDTAETYGNAEELIGSSLLKNPKLDFKIISKLSFEIEKNNYQISEKNLNTKIMNTLEKLNLNSIDSYLIHNPNNINQSNYTQLINWLKNLKDKNIIKRIGISIYNSEDLRNINLEDFDLVQLPLSIYDQRLLKDGTINNLLKSGIAIHMRSLFLQGLFLQDASEWPIFISNKFKQHHSDLKLELDNLGLNYLEAALFFAKNINIAESFLIGISNIHELREIVYSWKKINSKTENIKFDTQKWFWGNNNEIDPRKWP